MKHIQEKVKDIVEVRVFESLVDFTTDPVRTFSNYYFTDATAELMAKWIDAIAGLRGGKGVAHALAGYRGVGKSHFLATLGAIISMPELRLRISDAHVAASAQRLMRRHYPLAYVRRGTAETLVDELKAAVFPLLGEGGEKDLTSVPDIIHAASVLGGEMPFVLMIDTAFERGARVARDDGPILAEIAEAAKDLNVFVAVVLDDDIAGADGVNSAITRVFTIDYLDQEHLYKVVNTHVFPKYGQKQAVLHEIYEHFRSVVPGFRWSEQRFTSLYPLHPATLEVAPFVRLYVHEFALLGFASAAAERILGRPANSLIALDEVFDKSEKALRKIEELKEGFTAYDLLNSEVVSKIPVMQRLQAKLVLKALLLLSLDGQGTTAAEIAGSMLIFDEAEPERAVATVENWIKSFAEALPGEIRIDPDEGRGERYAFRLTSRDDLNKALAEKVSAVPDDVIPATLRRFFRERFADADISSENEEVRRDWMDCRVRWRGSYRPGRVIWADAASPADQSFTSDIFTDWEVTIDLTGRSETEGLEADFARVIWRPAQLRPDEIDIIRRYHLLSTDPTLRVGPGDETRASLHSHAVMVEQIVNRIFLEDGKVVIDGFDFNFTDESQTAKNLSDLFSIMLEPLFETRFPEHPFFTRQLAMGDIGAFAADLYSGPRQKLPEVQELAKAFGLPIGIVRFEDGFYVPANDEALREVPAASTILSLVDAAGAEPVSLDTIYAELRRKPHGWAREAQHLLLIALVAQRQLDFITFRGDRINRRSLDLQIIWDDIAAVSRAAGTVYSGKKLLPWARIFANNQDIKLLDGDREREEILTGLRRWLDEWRGMRIMERFAELADDSISAGIWKHASDCVRTLGPVAENVSAGLDGSISLEECLNRVADSFANSEEQFERAKSQLAVVDSFIKGSPQRTEILSYLSTCGFTGDDELEDTREQLYQVVDRSRSSPSDASNREMGYLWIKFQRDYSEYFTHRHNDTMSQSNLRQRLGEIEQTQQWWQFENLSQLPIFERKWWNAARHIRNRIVQSSCDAEVHEILKQRPFCTCSFELSRPAEIKDLTARLEQAITVGLDNYSATIVKQSEDLAARLERASASGRPDMAELAARLRRLTSVSELTDNDIFNLKSAVAAQS